MTTSENPIVLNHRLVADPESLETLNEALLPGGLREGPFSVALARHKDSIAQLMPPGTSATASA